MTTPDKPLGETINRSSQSLHTPEKDFMTYQRRLSRLDQQTLNVRLHTAISVYLGRKYRFDPQGDGPSGDIDCRAILNTSGFDCVTFCNIVLAMVSSDYCSEMQIRHRQIRYIDNVINYFHRHHFVESTWTTHNRKLGYLGGSALPEVTLASPKCFDLTLDYPAWLRYQATYLKASLNKTISVDSDAIPEFYRQITQLEVPYIPIEQLVNHQNEINLSLIKQIPPCCILMLVCADWDNTHNGSFPPAMLKISTQIAISHLGFITIEHGCHLFSHASLNTIVKTVSLEDYLIFVRSHLPYVSGIYLEYVSDQKA